VTTPGVRHIETPVHGRYLVRIPEEQPAGLIVGFHGYAENADVHLDALLAVPGTERWVLVAVQALHPFYTRDERVVANWMTKQDRELAIADNLAYVERVVDAVRGEPHVQTPLVFIGFSQGGAMAYRAAARLGADGLIILAADLPPDVATRPGLQLPPVLIGRGTGDRWYTSDKHDADLTTLAHLGVTVESCVFDGGHEWGGDFRSVAARYLQRLI
jgi:predicted esterase